MDEKPEPKPETSDRTRVELDVRPGIKWLTATPGGEKIISIAIHDGRLFVATENGVFVKGCNDIFRPILFESTPTQTEDV